MAKETEQERLARNPFPLPLFVQGTKVQVYMGAGWALGFVEESSQTRCTVKLKVGNKPVTIYDARSIRRHG
jgi:hypothetical protein